MPLVATFTGGFFLPLVAVFDLPLVALLLFALKELTGFEFATSGRILRFGIATCGNSETGKFSTGGNSTTPKEVPGVSSGADLLGQPAPTVALRCE